MKNIDVEKLNQLREERGFAIREVAEISGVPMSSCSKIFAGLNDNPTLVQEKEYYSDRKTAELAEQIFEKPELKILLDASRDLNVSDLKAVTEIVNKIKGAK